MGRRISNKYIASQARKTYIASQARKTPFRLRLEEPRPPASSTGPGGPPSRPRMAIWGVRQTNCACYAGAAMRASGRNTVPCFKSYKQELDGEDAMGLCPKPHQGGSPTLGPPAADVARHGSPAACRSCLDDAIHRFRAGQLRWPGCAQSAQQKTCVRPRKMSKLIFSDCRRFFFCPEALFATLKLQAQIVCERSQAGSPGAFFAAFFLRKKARIPLCQFRLAFGFSSARMGPGPMRALAQSSRPRRS